VNLLTGYFSRVVHRIQSAGVSQKNWNDDDDDDTNFVFDGLEQID